ncbi:ferrous iron transport protein A [Senegalia massiliensis]|uniref:Ferrous iron transport protein A n=2 Tax=Senegalia massiliensis TaxID=1720316 RepID=A0A845QXZ9_9CLOT|nr:FeoA family protein [Senegalia massiliensis]NBI05263.1 ferrous iron transport protein A [Senegalia massiliensis]
MNKIYEFKDAKGDIVKNLSRAKVNVEYTIKDIKTDDEEMKNFLFTLGCYEGEKVTIISLLGENYVISVKDARYSIDLELAKAIIV